jgi:DNA-binding NtrC family response regulator
LPSDVITRAVPTNTDDLGTVERQAIERVMSNTNGNKASAARKLGISRSQLYWRLSKYGLGIP